LFKPLVALANKIPAIKVSYMDVACGSITFVHNAGSDSYMGPMRPARMMSDINKGAT